MVTYDGQTAVRLETSDRVEIVRSAERVKMIRLKDSNFYEILRNKLGNV